MIPIIIATVLLCFVFVPSRFNLSMLVHFWRGRFLMACYRRTIKCVFCNEWDLKCKKLQYLNQKHNFTVSTVVNKLPTHKKATCCKKITCHSLFSILTTAGRSWFCILVPSVFSQSSILISRWSLKSSVDLSCMIVCLEVIFVFLCFTVYICVTSVYSVVFLYMCIIPWFPVFIYSCVPCPFQSDVRSVWSVLLLSRAELNRRARQR